MTNALNSINRSMGLADLYPFVLSDPAVTKLRFVHDVIAGQSEPARAGLEAEGRMTAQPTASRHLS